MRILPPVHFWLPLLLSSLGAIGFTADAPPTSALARNVGMYSTQPTLGAAVAVRDWKLPVGQMTFQMSSGTMVPLLSGGRTLGFHFQGTGSFTYRSMEPMEKVTLKSNFKMNLDVPNTRAILREDPGELVLTEAVNSFTLWQAGPGLLLPKGASAEVPTATFAKDWAYFGRDGLGDRGQDFAVHLANTPSRRLVRAEISGVDSPFVYVLDEGGSQRETLCFVAGPWRPATYDGLRLVVLSEQPIGWTRKEPLPSLIYLTHVDIDLRAGKAGADLKVTETLVTTDEGVSVVSLDLHSVVDPEAKKGIYTVSRVVDAEGHALPFHHRHDAILVQLNTTQRVGQPFTLTFEYGGEILLRPSGDNYWELGVEPWFPQPSLGGQSYTVHAVLRTHKDDVPIACGTTVRREKSEQGHLLEVRIDNPVQFFTVMAGAYTFTEDTQDGLTIRVAAYGNSGGGMQRRLIHIARQTIGFYEQLFEAFPFPEFNIVQINQLGFGQAPPGMMRITNEAFDGKMDAISSLFTRGINQRFAHEIAHQYWGHLVKMPAYEEQWVTESFANYTSALAMRTMKGKGDSTFDGMLSLWRNQATAYAKDGTIPFANRLRWIRDPRASFRARTTLLYEKGALILASLHKEMGDRAFALFMKSIIANFRWKTVTTASIEQIATMAGRKDFGPLFRDCYWGTQMPK